MSEANALGAPDEKPLFDYLPYQMEYLVEEEDLDFLGHMNNIAYLRLFERARWRMITERNYGLSVIHARKQGPVILGIELEFRKEILLRQRVLVEGIASPMVGKVALFTQTVRSESGEVHAVGRFKIGLFDLKARKLLAPTAEWRVACGEVPRA